MLNTLETLVTDEEMLEKDDLQILDRMRYFALSPEVVKNPAAKRLIVAIDRVGVGSPSLAVDYLANISIYLAAS